MSFEIFNFDKSLLSAIEQAKFTRASKIQKLVIPEVLLGHDVIASAHSGSGKSASFVLPLIQLLLNNKSAIASEQVAEHFSADELHSQNDFNDEESYSDTYPIELENDTDNNTNNDTENNSEDLTENYTDNYVDNSENNAKPENGPKVLILAPTRELANQISACIRRFTKDLNLRYGILVGGAPYPPQVRMLKKPVDFLVATPGRLLDHLKNNRVNFDKIEYLVIDEINRMIDMKMNNDLLEIYSYIPKYQTLENGDTKPRQTLLFSGSLEGEALENISKEFQNNPTRFELARSKQSYRALHQSMYIADEEDHKFKLCQALITSTDSKQIIICSTQTEHLQKFSEFLNTSLPEITIKNQHLLITNEQKHIYLQVDEQSLDESFNETLQKTKIIHLDLPDDILVFLQRLEPAIDQQSSEEHCLLVGKDEWPMLHQIERYIGKTLSRKKIEGLEPIAGEPSVSSQISSGKFTNQTKNRNPYSGRRQNNKNHLQNNKTRNKNHPNTRTAHTNSPTLSFDNMNSADIYNDQLLGNTIVSPNQHANPAKTKNSKAKHTQKRKKPSQAINAGDSKNINPKNRNHRQHKKPQQNSNNPQLGGNNFNSIAAVDDRDLSWKQYISNISNGNAPSKTANKKFRNQHSSQNGFDLNHSPMAISAKKVRDLAKNEAWAAEKKEADKPSVQIRVKGAIKAKSAIESHNLSHQDNQKNYADYDAERIDGKLGINK